MKYLSEIARYEFNRPMVWVAMVFSGGVLFGVINPEARAAYGAMALCAIPPAALLAFRRNGAIFRVSIGCIVALVGIYLGARSLNPVMGPDHVAMKVGRKTVTLRGALYSLPRRYPDNAYLYVDTNAVKAGDEWVPTRGKIRVTVSKRCPHPSYGDELIFDTKVRRPRSLRNPGAFNYERYMAAQGIFATGYVYNGAEIILIPHGTVSPRAFIQRLRQSISRSIDRAGEGRPESEVLRALVVGDRWAVPDYVNETFARAGVAHLLAVSGLHLGIIASLSYLLILFMLQRSEKLMLAVEVRRLAAAFTIAPVIAYAELAGGRVPTIRSAIMVTVYLVAVALRRWKDLPGSIALAAVVILAIWPASITGAGFILSFSAVIIIAALIPTMGRLFPTDDEWDGKTRWKRLKRNAKFTVTVSTVIMIATMPMLSVMGYGFQYISPVTNLLFIPLVGYLALPLGMVAVVLYPLSTRFGDWLIGIDLKLLDKIIDSIEWFSKFPGAGAHMPMADPIQASLIFVAVIGFVGWLGPPGRRRLLSKTVTMIAIPFLLIYTSLVLIDRLPDRFEVVCLDAGSGSASVIRTPSGMTMLVDTGDKLGGFDGGERIVGPYLRWSHIGKIDVIVISHPHYKNAGGLEWLLDNFPVGEIWMPDAVYSRDMSERVEWHARQHSVPVRRLSFADGAFEWGGLVARVLWPSSRYGEDATGYPDVNSTSLVFTIGNGDFGFLFAGDAQSSVQRKIMVLNGRIGAHCILVPRHGGRESLLPEFLDALDPFAVIVQSSMTVVRGRPDPDTIMDIKRSGARLFITGRDGAVRVRPKKDNIIVDTWDGRNWRRAERSGSSI